jgi:hypothetical protein
MYHEAKYTIIHEVEYLSYESLQYLPFMDMVMCKEIQETAVSGCVVLCL